MARYHFVTVYEIPAPIERVWHALRTFEAYPTYTRSFVEAREQGHGAEAVVSFRVRGRLPFTLGFEARLGTVDPPKAVEIRATGELDGVGRWTLRQEEGTTTVRCTWDVVTKKLWMNVLAPLARPVFERNHDEVMRDFGRGLARHLGVALLSCTTAASRTGDNFSTTG